MPLYAALREQRPKLFDGPVMVVRVNRWYRGATKRDPFALDAAGHHETSDFCLLKELYNEVLNTQYCENLDEEPETSDIEFSLVFRDLRWYFHQRSIHCESGG